MNMCIPCCWPDWTCCSVPGVRRVAAPARQRVRCAWPCCGLRIRTRSGVRASMSPWWQLITTGPFSTISYRHGKTTGLCTLGRFLAIVLLPHFPHLHGGRILWSCPFRPHPRRSAGVATTMDGRWPHALPRGGPPDGVRCCAEPDEWVRSVHSEPPSAAPMRLAP